jgi:hypothetical protein
VIVDNLDLIAVTFLPDETDPDLLIDPDTVLSLSVTFQSLQTVPGGYQQIRKLGGT